MNTLTLGVNFSFKGQLFSPRATLDLDALLSRYQDLPNLYDLLARANGFDDYSYEREVMESYPLEVYQTSGWASDLVALGELDEALLNQAWLDKALEFKFRHLLNTYAPQQAPTAELIAALQAAYELGKQQA